MPNFPCPTLSENILNCSMNNPFFFDAASSSLDLRAASA